MRNRQEADVEGAGLDLIRPGIRHRHGIVADTVFRQLSAGDIRGEGAGIDLGSAQAFEQVADRADVVFVRVGDEHRLKPVASFLKPGDIGKNQVHAGRAVHVGKGDADVDKDQPFLPRRAVAIDIGVHADFPGTAEGEIDQPFSCHALPCSRL